MLFKETPFASFQNANTIPSCVIPSPHGENSDTEKEAAKSHFKACVIPNGISVSESLSHPSVTISILTLDGTVHQLLYFLDQNATMLASEEADIRNQPKIERSSEIYSGISLFSFHDRQQGSILAVTKQDGSMKLATDVLNLLYSYQIISGVTSTDAIAAALWINGHNLIIGTLAGQLIGANLPVDATPLGDTVSISSQGKMHEFTFSNSSLFGWFWHGVLGTSKRKQLISESDSDLMINDKDSVGCQRALDQGFAESIIAIAYLVASSDEDSTSELRENGGFTDLNDLLLVSLSADLTLAVWSYRTRSCIATQSLSSLFLGSRGKDYNDIVGQLPAHELALHNQTVTAAKVVILPDSTQDDCRILTAFVGSSTVFLLRGELHPSKHTANLTVTREFTVQDDSWGKSSICPKFVDLCFDKGCMYSAWRYHGRDWFFVHNEATRRTGPRYMAGTLLESLGGVLDEWRSDEAHLLQELVMRVPDFALHKAEHTKETQKIQLKAIDRFFLDRIMDVPFFSGPYFNYAMRNLDNTWFSDRSFMSAPSTSFKLELIKAVDKDWIATMKDRTRRDARQSRCTVQAITPGLTDYIWLRFLSWTRLLDSCLTAWHHDCKFFGFTDTMHSPFSGLPLLVHQNRVSWPWPAPSYLLEDHLINKTSGAEMLKSSVLPLFSKYQISCLQYKVEEGVISSADLTKDLHSTATQDIMNAAKHITRLIESRSMEYGCKEFGRRAFCSLDLLLKLRTALYGEPELQMKVLADLVASSTPVNEVLNEYSPSDVDMDMVAIDGITDEEALESDECCSTTKSQKLVHGRHQSISDELMLSLAVSVKDAVNLMRQHSTRIVLLLAYLTECRPIFVSKRVLEYVHSELFANAITSLRQWTMAELITHISSLESGEPDPIECESATRSTSCLFGSYMKEKSAQWSDAQSHSRALSILVGSFHKQQLSTCGTLNTAIRISDVQLTKAKTSQDSLKCAVMELVSLVYYGRDGLLDLLCEKNHYQLAISMMTNKICTSDANNLSGECVSTDPVLHPAVLVKIGECFARDGYKQYGEAKNKSLTKNLFMDDTKAIFTNTYAISCFRQAIRCFSWCLPSVVAEEDDVFTGTTSIKKFLSGVIAVLKECIPLEYSRELLQFLWTVAAKFSHDEQVLNDSLNVPNSNSLYSQAWGIYMAQDPALQTLVWINIFKYSLENLDLRSAHVALMRLSEVSQCSDTEQNIRHDEMTFEATNTQEGIIECISQFVKKCMQHGHLDSLCDLQWASSEQQIDKYLEWHAAHCNVLKKETFLKGHESQPSVVSIDWAVVDIYKSLYALNMRNRQPIHAASTMYSLYLRLKWTTLSCNRLINQCLTLQHEAITVTYSVLLSVPLQHRWLTRKFLGEEIMARLQREEESPVRNSADKMRIMKQDCKEALSIATFADIASEMVILSGKAWLLQHRHFLESLSEDGGFVDARVLYPLGASDIVPLLLHSALVCCRYYDSASVTESAFAITKNDKERIASQALELIWAILAQNIDKKEAEYHHVLRSISRMCVTSGSNASSLCFILLRSSLNHVGDDLSAWELAAQILLDPEHVNATRRRHEFQGGLHICVPKWFMEGLEHRSPTTLLKMFLRYGIILEAFRLAMTMIPDGLLHESEEEFVLRIRESNIRKLPWLPWNLFDMLLEMGAEFRNNIPKEDVSLIENVTAAMAHFSSKLERYIRYIHRLDAAQSIGIATLNSDALSRV
uniref:Uncharacterized protein AlNc14C44G3632 n=1 Tax=Albugo laibachii Nc14 TaxID=890382 RepID=F0WAA3_9STRA|nr:conserved hypothetical protein [Albugo laibachii Nc14]|eukprot:CCA18073.1 conserved hypothetical protein [Albugo laibachii Nc14]